MSLLSKVQSASDVNEEEQDILGAGGGLWPSNIYKTKIVLAYLTQSESGAIAVNLTLKNEAGKELRKTIYVSTGSAKRCVNYYEKDGKKHTLPGYNIINSMCLLAIGKKFESLVEETKTVNIYNYDSKAEVPTEVPMLTELLNQEIYVAVIQQTVSKKIKNDQGQYVPTAETYDENEIEKFFRVRDKCTTQEIRKKQTAVFFDAWLAQWQDKVKTKIDKNAPAAAVKSGALGGTQSAAPVMASPEESLFA